MKSAKELLEKHLGPARMSDAVNRLAKLVDLEDLAATDPPKFLHAVADRIEGFHNAILDGNEEKAHQLIPDRPDKG